MSMIVNGRNDVAVYDNNGEHSIPSPPQKGV